MGPSGTPEVQESFFVRFAALFAPHRRDDLFPSVLIAPPGLAPQAVSTFALLHPPAYPTPTMSNSTHEQLRETTREWLNKVCQAYFNGNVTAMGRKLGYSPAETRKLMRILRGDTKRIARHVVEDVTALVDRMDDDATEGGVFSHVGDSNGGSNGSD